MLSECFIYSGLRAAIFLSLVTHQHGQGVYSPDADDSPFM
ncbi:hypothetical protein PEC301937_16660 [Pectobacterium carotovorum subsp. carotovorum]|nr:hypothetical protein KKH3_12950 [Pectobacterium actinidiae]GKW15717.1 hypothetical protein PEC301937_16660 [Pectobacterium carotovorum subsp. carotovorum]